MKSIRRLAIYLALTLIAGCASHGQKMKDERLRGLDAEVLRNGFGIILLSTSASQKCLGAKTHIDISKIGASNTNFNFAYIDLNNWNTASDFKDREGRILGYRLEPGEYKASISALGWTSKEGLEANFTVSAGSARYFGDIHVTGCNPIQLRTANRWNEMKSEFQTRMPNFDFETIRVTPINFETKPQ